jgi:hypothetical protein
MSEARSTTKSDAAPKGRPWAKRYDPLTSLVLVVPVFLIYHLGILLMDRRNGVDMASAVFFGILRQSVGLYIGITVAIAVALIGAGFYLRKKGKARVFDFVPVLVESTLWAIGLSVTVGWATAKVVPGLIEPLQMAGEPMGPLDKLVMSAGAGFHEELVFRVFLFGGLAFFLRRVLNVRATWSLVTAIVVSSAIFSGIHYVGALGDEFTIASFVFRFFAGVYLALVFRFRGFAVAVYAHAIFDVIVLFLLQ